MGMALTRAQMWCIGLVRRQGIRLRTAAGFTACRRAYSLRLPCRTIVGWLADLPYARSNGLRPAATT